MGDSVMRPFSVVAAVPAAGVAGDTRLYKHCNDRELRAAAF
jgi:hypothetical protein